MSLIIKPNNSHTFTNHITLFDGNPVVPAQPGTYQIIENSGTVITEGPLERGENDGDFLFVWGAPGSDLDNPYSIRWKVLDVSGQNVETTTSFEIEEDVPEDFSHTTLLTENFKGFPMEFPESGSYNIQFIDQYQTVTYSQVHVIETPGLQPVEVIGTLPAGMNGEFVGVAENMNNFQQYLTNYVIAPLRFWHLLPRLRIYIDRAKYPYDQIKAYQDSFAYNYFIEGLAKINRVGSLTSYDWNTFPHEPLGYGLEGLWIQAAAFYALRSQYLLEVELSFDYQGPNISVDHDHASGLEAEIGRIEAELDEALMQLKKLMWSKGKVGTLAHRRYTSRSYAKTRRRLGY